LISLHIVIEVSPHSAIIKNLMVSQRILFDYIKTDISGIVVANSIQTRSDEKGKEGYKQEIESAHGIVFL
jgi:hypothetical protein